jgi:hypothetical protein
MKGETNELETNGTKILKTVKRNEFKNGLQFYNTLVKDEIGDLHADSYSILNR